MNLTEEQRAAVVSEAENTLVTAPAGSGKTAVIAARIRHLIDHGTDPHDIAVVTYTNEAARVVQERIEGRLGFAGTLHTFCARHVRANIAGAEDWRVIDDEEKRERMRRAAEDTCCKESIDRLDEIHATWDGPEANSVGKIAVARYRQEAMADGVMDYDAILQMAMMSMKASPGTFWEHLIVDEWQDAAEIDWMIYSHAKPGSRFMVGDPMQAIFGFRERGRPGLDLGRTLTHDWARFTLTENWRSTPEICAAASRLSGAAREGVLKAARTLMNTPSPVRGREFDNEAGEALAIAEACTVNRSETTTTAILARTNAVADYILETLRAHGVKTRHLEEVERPADWRQAMAALGWLARPHSPRAFKRYGFETYGSPEPAGKALVTSVPITGDADKLADELVALGVGLDSVMAIGERLAEMPTTATLLDLEASLALDTRRTVMGWEDGVWVGTIHGAKGREFDRVILAGFEEEIIPGRSKRRNLDEERRVAYVGATRARDELIFTWARSRRANFGLRHPERHEPSRFLREAIG